MREERLQDDLSEKILKPPEMKSRVRLWKYQWIGVPILLLLPVLSLTGFLSEKQKTETFSYAGLEGEVEYPERTRMSREEKIVIVLRNRSEKTVKNIKVRFDAPYVEKFEMVQFVPGVRENYEIHIPKIARGEMKRLLMNMKASNYGSLEGHIDIIQGEGVPHILNLKTVIWP